MRCGGTGTGRPCAPRGRGRRGSGGRGCRGRRVPPSPAPGSVSGTWWIAHQTRYSSAAIGIFSPTIRYRKVQDTFVGTVPVIAVAYKTPVRLETDPPRGQLRMTPPSPTREAYVTDHIDLATFDADGALQET